MKHNPATPSTFIKNLRMQIGFAFNRLRLSLTRLIGLELFIAPSHIVIRAFVSGVNLLLHCPVHHILRLAPGTDVTAGLAQVDELHNLCPVKCLLCALKTHARMPALRGVKHPAEWRKGRAGTNDDKRDHRDAAGDESEADPFCDTGHRILQSKHVLHTAVNPDRLSLFNLTAFIADAGTMLPHKWQILESDRAASHIAGNVAMQTAKQPL
jgi:hypothetical protein